jgi:methionine aminopeptidase
MQLVEETHNAVIKAIEFCKPGKYYREIGNIIRGYVE